MLKVYGIKCKAYVYFLLTIILTCLYNTILFTVILWEIYILAQTWHKFCDPNIGFGQESSKHIFPLYVSILRGQSHFQDC